ncbi:hypothetical protein WOLCODRAFT_149930 [Wolfiporia cocos MD-104 SS10]|uniref:Uncharacterized protein n=1 Tax=Wolfiporia cocos (strain MD-104) TaxID=742152 RepID=A0A2H3JM54_WOLCO|nr:hypothetical protein WOLCODRAFT_149930 [Wolfiporia cocos MD-104 SS10]
MPTPSEISELEYRETHSFLFEIAQHPECFHPDGTFKTPPPSPPLHAMPPSIPVTISTPTPTPIKPVTVSTPTPTRTPTPPHVPMPPPIVTMPPSTYDHPIGPPLPTHSHISTSPRNTIIQINNVLCRNLDWTIVDRNGLTNQFFTTLDNTSFLNHIPNSIHVLDLDYTYKG